MMSRSVCVSIGPFIWTLDPQKLDIRAKDIRPIYTAIWDGEAKVDWGHPFGTDNLGKDLLAQMMQGGRISMAVGWTGMLLALVTGAFTDCDFMLSRTGTLPDTNCAISGVLDTNGFGEQLVEATVTIPSQNDPVNPYLCNVNDPNDCWITVRAQFAGGLTDATTWTANLIGDAVRIIDDD